jgi:hypothetical protein
MTRSPFWYFNANGTTPAFEFWSLQTYNDISGKIVESHKAALDELSFS